MLFDAMDYMHQMKKFVDRWIFRHKRDMKKGSHVTFEGVERRFLRGYKNMKA